MIMYIKQRRNANIISRMLNMYKIEKNEDKNFMYIPIKESSSTKKIEKVCKKANKYLYDNNIKDIILENTLMENEVAKNEFYSNNLNILEGTKLSKIITYNIIHKIYEYKNKKLEESEITFLINENDDINIQIITMIAKETRRINMITKNIKKFENFIKYMYIEYGIIIKLSSNIKTNLKGTELLVNMDFPEEIINKLYIPNNITILNIPKDIEIKAKRFSGINIKSWEIEVPKQYALEDFKKEILYEAYIYKKPIKEAFEQIKKDKIKIKSLKGKNGTISSKEFKEILKKST